jgi:hypothetical protein
MGQMRNSSMIPYNVYCDLLDYIGENYHNLKQETLVEDWWSDLSPSDQDKYIKDHPNSEKAKEAAADKKDKEQGSDKNKPEPLGYDRNRISKSATQAAIKDLKTHVDDVVKSVGIDAKLVTKAIKEKSVYNTVNALGGTLRAAGKTVRGLMKGVGKSLEVGGAALTDTPGFDKLQKGMISFDKWIEKNPAAKKITGVALAGAAVYQWWEMSFSGDTESDFDLTSVTAALTGKPADAVPTLNDFLGTPSGVKNMALLGGGLATSGFTALPYAALGSTGIGLGVALTYSGLKALGETKAGKKVKAKMVEMGKEAVDKIQKGAKAVDKKRADKKLGIKKEEKMRFSSFVLPRKVIVIEEDDGKLDEGIKSQGGGSKVMDLYFVYKFAKFIALPWEEWPAFKLGIIDDAGNVIKRTRTSSEEKNNYTLFHRLLRKLKQLLEKVPGMKSKIGKAVAAYFLFKEGMVKHGANGELLDEAFMEYINDTMSLEESIQIGVLMKQYILLEKVK